MNITGQTSITFQIKACYDVRILLGNSGTENSDRLFYTVIVGTEFLQIQTQLWILSGLNCSDYVDLWISWSTIFKAGTGTNIGEDIIGTYPGSFMNKYINYVEVVSTYQAYWILELPDNLKNACTSMIPGSNDTAIETIKTTSPTSNIIQTERSATEPRCTCSCDNITNTPLTNDELIQKIEQLRSELTVDKKKTSRYKRSLISTADDRSSSKCIGSFSVVVLAIVICVIVLMDFCHYSLKIFPQKK
ncbi:Hypothetical predicted protein [Mytilus galloprovincialis]|uniref:Farnesoic acid O-methyl transferase domain-containing protein n=1 Tax=Mytilus galloprovincialis TaxID=29158 RepID=A0A8B6F1J4_MYTGA|nr:Hypothetical predicted protein [Mytilus galloprovincialis]